MTAGDGGPCPRARSAGERDDATAPVPGRNAAMPLPIFRSRLPVACGIVAIITILSPFWSLSQKPDIAVSRGVSAQIGAEGESAGGRVKAARRGRVAQDRSRS